MPRGVAALGEVIEEMICDRTRWKHSIKAGENFLQSQRGRANFGALAL